MKKAPKRKGYAGGGEIPKFNNREEFDRYYTGLGHKVDPLFSSPGNNRYYDPAKLTYDPTKKQYTGSGVGNGAWTSTPEASNFAEFQSPVNTLTPSPAKNTFVDSGRKPVMNGNSNYQSFQYPDTNSQYGNATTKHFDKTTGQEIDPMKSFDPSGKYVPYGLKNGGIVKKIRGYSNGTPVTGIENDSSLTADQIAQQNAQKAKNTQLTNSGIGIASQLGTMGGQYLQSQSIGDDGTVNVEQATGAGALKGAGKGASIGMALGPEGAAAGALLGAAIGGGTSYFGAKNLNSDISFGQTLAKNNQALQDQNNKFSNDLNKQMQQRQEGYAKGGIIKGLGGPKSDSIKAKVKPGSFIVPAEKLEEAKEVKKIIAPKKKGDDEEAELNQKGGADVKLSNKEFMFTPEEKNEIISELGEEFLQHLAPNAKHENKAFHEGGPTPEKARIMLHEGMANGQKLTDKQRGYFGLIASGYKCGGMVKGYAQGGETGFESPEEKKYKAAQKQYAELLQEEKDLASSKDKKVLTRLGDVRAQRTAIEKEYGFNNKSVNTNLPSKTGAEIDKALGNTTTPKLNTKGNTFTPKLEDDSNVTVPKVEDKNKVTFPSYDKITDSSLVDSALAQEKLSDQQNKPRFSDAQKQNLLNKGQGIASQIGGLGNYLLPFQQYKMGQKFLAQSGARPKGQIDPDFQNSVNQAQANAKFGYTPEEQAMLNSNNINALRAGQNAAQNYSGGSSANAINLSRDAANSYYSRGLQALIGNKNAMFQKQGLAAELNGQKAAMNRQLFQDNLNAWNANQQAGGALVGAGIQNLLGARRLGQEQQFNQQYQNNSNPYTQGYFNNLGS